MDRGSPRSGQGKLRMGVVVEVGGGTHPVWQPGYPREPSVRVGGGGGGDEEGALVSGAGGCGCG